MIALIKKNSLKVMNCFMAERFSLNLSERGSTATITVGPEAPAIAVGDWVRDDDDPGAGIVFRVKSVATDYATETRTVVCEHVINVLKDLILFGETTPGTMAGKKTAKDCTAKQAATYILSKSGVWTLGTFGYTKSAPYSFNGDNLFSALETVSSSLMDAWWSYDFSSYPFKLNINPQSAKVSCEMRMDRNIKTLKKTIDRTRMFTRFYPIGKNDLHITGNYIQKNTDLYGVVSKVETDQEKDTEDKLKAWAEERLNNHCEPIVTVSVSGLDMSKATGEALDKLTLGTVCRIPLPELGTVMEERITALNWGDKIADPESVTVTLANQVEDVATIVNRLQKSAGGGGRSAAKKAKEDHAWFVDTETHVGMVAEALAGEGADQDWSRVSQIMVDGKGISATVTKAVGDIVQAQSKIEQNENHIGLVVSVNKDGKGTIRAGQICLAINEDKSTKATIEATKIHLLGDTIAKYITADRIKAKVAEIPLVTMLSANVTGTLNVRNASGSMQNVTAAIWDIQLTQSGNTYTLKRKRMMDGDYVDIGSFSRAVTDWGYSWSGGQLTVTAYPQGSSKAIIGVKTAGSWSGRTYNGRVVYWDGGDDSGPTYNTGATFALTYTAEKSDITMIRSSNPSSSMPSTDSSLTQITANGWYTLTVTACGVTKTYRVNINV